MLGQNLSISMTKTTEIIIVKVQKVTINHPSNFVVGELKQLSREICSSNGVINTGWDMTDVDFEVDNLVDEIINVRQE